MQEQHHHLSPVNRVGLFAGCRISHEKAPAFLLSEQVFNVVREQVIMDVAACCKDSMEI